MMYNSKEHLEMYELFGLRPKHLCFRGRSAQVTHAVGHLWLVSAEACVGHLSVSLDAVAAIISIDSSVDKLALGTEMTTIAPAKLTIAEDSSKFPHEISEYHA